MPSTEGLDAHLITPNVNDRAVARDERSGRSRIRFSIALTDLVEHQFRVVVELNREPIPPLLILAKSRAAELVVHPGRAAAFLSIHSSADLEPRHRVVVRCVSDSFAFYADAVLAVNRRRLARAHHEIDGIAAVECQHA